MEQNIVFKSKAAGHLKMVSNDDDYVDIVLRKIASTIVTESKHLKRDQTRITLHDCIYASSQTLLSLM